MSINITSPRDLSIWVADRAGDYSSEADMQAIVRAILGHPGRPNWGADWSEFLDSLPDNLHDLTH